MNCNRRGIFRQDEHHKCFVKNCRANVNPNENETCEICNWKKCNNGHCGCDVSKETRNALEKFYDLFCEPHNYSNETKYALNNMLETYMLNCLDCLETSNKVIWIENKKVIHWNPIRTPALGWNTLTLLEALTDSAKTSLAVGNEKRAKKQLNKLLKILREKIKYAKKNHRPLIQRCEFRETPRTRCNKTPVKGIKNGLHLCEYHYKKAHENNNLETFLTR